MTLRKDQLFVASLIPAEARVLDVACGTGELLTYLEQEKHVHGQGMELDAIASVVIGGTLLAGGVGMVAGTLCGVLMLGLIQTLITFDGTLSAWWTRIVIGALLLAFCLLQRLTQRAAGPEPA